MPKNVTINVPEGYTTHRGVRTTIVLREPTYDDYLDLGEIFDPVPSGDGRAFMMENKATVRAYVDRLTVEPSDKLILGDLPMKYAREVRQAVIGFFLVSREGAESKTSGENSSGEPTGAFQPDTSNA